MLFVKLKDMLFHYALHLQVNGRYDRASVFRLFYRALYACFIVKISVFPAVSAIQYGIVRSLDSIASHIAVNGESDYIACKCFVRIFSDIIFFQPYAFYVRIFLFIRIYLFKLFCFLIIDSFFQNVVPAPRIVFYQFSDVFLLDSEAVFEHFNCRFHIVIFARHHFYVQNDIVHTLTRSNLCSVPVYDISPPERDRPAVVLLLVQHYLRVPVAAGRINICNSPH